MQKKPSIPAPAPSIDDAIDTAVVRRVMGDDRQLIEDLFAEFLPGARAGIAEIEQAVAGGMAGPVGRAGHKLKGACALVGAQHLIALCQQLEGAAKDDDWPRIRQLAALLEPRMKEVELASRAFLRQIARSGRPSPQE
jgi:HPt (histidine-containing phosphotransfer) domain-containing protein